MPEDTIRFSVVIPTYNRVQLLRNAVESLFRQDFSGFEIIVVNDGSTDGTTGYLSDLSLQKKIIYLEQANQGPARGRNLGLARARGEFVAFLDDDCVAPPDWLSRYARKFQHGNASGFGGITRTGNPDSLFAVANDLTVNFFKEQLNSSPDQTVPFLTSNNAAYRRTALEKVGGFDPRFRIGAEERDLNLRLYHAGERLGFDPAIAVDHFNDAGFPQFLRHQYHQGQGSYLLYHPPAGMAAPVHAARIPLRSYGRLIASAVQQHTTGRGIALAALLILAQMATAAGYAAQAASGRSGQEPRSMSDDR